MADQNEKNAFTAEAINPAASDALYLQKYFYAEDAGGGPESWLAMGNAATNRLKSGKYGKTLQQVIKGMSSAIQTKSPQWQKADKLEFNDFEFRAFNKMKPIAEGIVGGQAPDTIKGATHFENLNKFPMPYWAKEMDAVSRVGQHTYFKERVKPVKVGRE